MARTVPIALVFSFSLAYCRGVLRGISRYATDHPEWTLVTVAPGPALARSLAASAPRGVIAHIYDEQIARAVAATRQPAINVCGIMPQLPFPRIGIDDLAVGALAARHFLDRGLRSFACIGHPAHGASITREIGFRTALAREGCGSDHYHINPALPFDPTCTAPMLGGALGAWLRRLPRPTGIFCANDIIASQLSEACRQLQLMVPEQLCILGVDNDDLLCNLSRPPLSSIALPAQEVGIQAALHLERMLKGERAVLRTPLLLSPLETVVRRSSDLMAISDSDIAAVCRYVRDNAYRAVSVDEAVRVVRLGRRTLERRFRSMLGRGLADEIRRCHIERAKGLLADGRLAIATVAARSGFTSAKQFSTAFRAATGMTPVAYRRQSAGIIR